MAHPLSFVSPWAPAAPVLVERLKAWSDDDARELSLQRDVAAARKVGELLGAPVPRADELLATFRELADVGYAGYCFHDFAGVSLTTLLVAYEKLSRQYVGDDAFKAVYRWFWLDELFDIDGTERPQGARMVLKSASSFEEDNLFGHLLQMDQAFGAPVDATQEHLWRAIASEYAAYHAGYEVYLPDARDFAILAMMDLVDLTTPTVEVELGRRFAYARGYRDMAGGRVFPRDMVGRIWVNYDTSIAYEPDAGMDHPRIAFALGAQTSTPHN